LRDIADEASRRSRRFISNIPQFQFG